MKNITLKDRQALLILNRLQTGRTAPFIKLFQESVSAVQILDMIKGGAFPGMLEELRVLEKAFHPEQEMERCSRENVSLVSFYDPDYPALLKEIFDPPLVLYVKGRIFPSDNAALAIVGSRHASFYGTHQARRFARELAQSGFTIVSGLARGIDLAAHEGALEVPSGRTLAVLGCGVDIFYPKENASFYSRISEKGAVISEYSLGAEPCAYHFPKRNRIISGLSLGILVVEAHVRSGSLITARQALDQGREVFAMPGRIDQLTSQGTHQLLREGACLADSPGVLIEAMAPEAKRILEVPAGREEPLKKDEQDLPADLNPAHSFPEELDSTAIEIVSFLKEEGALTPDELQCRCGLRAEVFFSTLSMLELSKRIKKTQDGMLTANVR